MIREVVILTLTLSATICAADETREAPPAQQSERTARPRQAPVPTPVRSAAASGNKAAPTESTPKFISEAKWMLAGYNNNEVVYAVFVTNQDTRVIRCTTEVSGFYFENNAKLSISDRQVTTVFPDQPTQVGYWMDMDERSGATYKVTCRPI